MRIKEFYDFAHARSYLGHSIIRFQDDPIYVQGVMQTEKRHQFLLHYLPIHEVQRDAYPRIGVYPSEGFNLDPCPLGMVDGGNAGLYYAQRMPVRQWKIGLTPNNTYIVSVARGPGRGLGSTRSILYSKRLKDTITNNYRYLDDIMKAEMPCGAFSRRFGVVGDKLFFKRTGQVGLVKNGDVTLDNKFFYLREVLDEDLR